MPFWHGDRPGRPLELGRALGAFVRELRELPPAKATAMLRDEYALDELAATNLLQYLDEQAEATGVVPDDRTIVVERFRDEIGDWRVCLLSPFGTPVHAPWAMAIERRLADRFDLPVESMWGDDGIVLRLPEAADELPVDALLIEPEDIEELVVSTLPQTALFSSRFRECAARALLLPRRRPDQRTPLWQQRQRAADLLAVAAKYPTFPILLEASRECLQDVFDVPALRDVLGQLRSRSIRVVTVDTTKPSPMAQSLLFNWIAAYMYEGDAPLAERRAAALALDRDLLRDLLGAEELRELLDPGVLADVELDLQRLSDGRRARSADELHDVLRRVGDLTATEVDLRERASRAPGWLAELVDEKRAIEVERRRRGPLRGRRGRGALPRRARVRPAARAPGRLHRPRAATDRGPRRPLRPHARTVHRARGRRPARHPRVARARSARRPRGRRSRRPRRVPSRGRPPGVVRQRGAAPAAPAIAGRAAPRGRAGRAGGAGPLPAGVARRAAAAPGRRRRRRGARSARRRADRGVDARDATCCRPGSTTTARRSSTSCARRATCCGSAPGRSARTTAGSGCASPTSSPSWRLAGRLRSDAGGVVHDAIRLALGERGASFWAQLRAAAPGTPEDELLVALWDLVWAGEVTNDSLAPLRAITRAGGGRAVRAGTAGPAPVPDA